MFSFALAMRVALIAVILCFRDERVFWLLGGILVAIWVGFRGGPMLLRLLERVGFFGRLRLHEAPGVRRWAETGGGGAPRLPVDPGSRRKDSRGPAGRVAGPPTSAASR